MHIALRFPLALCAFVVAFVLTISLFSLANLLFAYDLTLFAHRVCNEQPPFYCYFFDLVHRWYFIAAVLVSLAASALVVIAVNRRAV